MSIINNTTRLQELLDIANALPEAGSGGVELPALSNPASEAEIFSGYEAIDAEGNVKTGTFTIDDELSMQDDLIAQIQTALENKASGNGGIALKTCNVSVTNLDEFGGVNILYYDANGVYQETGYRCDSFNFSCLEGYLEIQNLDCITINLSYSITSSQPTVNGSSSSTQGKIVCRVYGDCAIEVTL